MLGLLSLDDVHSVGGCIAAAVLCSSGCSSWEQLQSVSNIGMELMDVCLCVEVRCMWWKVTFSLFITLSCLIPALWKAQHLLRLIQHQSTMKSCLFFSIWHPARSHLHYISCSPSPCRGSHVKKSKGMPTLHSSCPPLLPSHTFFPQ